jgi:hypothetical protein
MRLTNRSYREIIAEIFKSMFHSRGNQREIVRSKLPALTRANEITAAADNNIDFIAAMRYLGIVPARRVEFQVSVPCWNSAMERSCCDSGRRSCAFSALIVRVLILIFRLTRIVPNYSAFRKRNNADR